METLKGHPLHPFFWPDSVAVIGASSKPGKVGYAIMSNLILGAEGQLGGGFRGHVYPVNPSGEDIFRQRTFKKVGDIPGPVDLAVVAIPAAGVEAVLDECAKKGIRAAVLITSGFSESGSQGREREKRVVEKARASGMRLLGPNCIGVINTGNRLNTTFAKKAPPRGPISFVSQSGAICTSVIEYSMEEYMGFANFVSIGNKSDLEDSDIIEYYANDPSTKCVSIYMESAKDGRRFYETLKKKVVPRKPVVILKAGRTASGARAASSHTGALAGSDTAYSAAIQESGAIRAFTMLELFDFSRALAYQPPVMGDGIAIISNAGGPAVIAADVAYDIGLPLATLSPDTLEAIDSVCPPTWSRNNPVDVIGDSDLDRYQRVLELLVKAPEVHGVITIVGPQAVMPLEDVAHAIVDVSRTTQKPFTASFVGVVSQVSEDYLDSHGIPEMEVPERPVRAMKALHHRGQYLRRRKFA
jgi:acetyltransferase